MGRRRRRLGLLVVVLLTIGWSGSASAAIDSTCPTMKVFGIRGSGETNADYGGYGHTVKDVMERIHEQVPTASTQAIDYQAIGVNFTPSYFGWRYHDSVISGDQELVKQITSFVNGSCGRTTYIYLVGFSQGAQVAADTYQTKLTSALKSRVKGMVLLGDPKFDPTEETIDVGGFRRSSAGILVDLDGLRRFSSGDKSQVRSYCNFTDAICSFSALSGFLCLRKSCDHLHYWDEQLGDTTYTGAAAKFLVGRWRTVGPQIVHVGSRTNILVFGVGDLPEDPNQTGRANIAAGLRAAGYTVTFADRLPADVSRYGQVWWYGLEGVAGGSYDVDRAQENQLIQYVRSGGSLYLTGEWSRCCSSPTNDQVVADIFDSLVVTVGGLQLSADIGGFGTLNPSVEDQVATRPNRLTSFTGNYVGTISSTNIASKNFLFTDGAGNGVIGVWDNHDVVGGGRLAIVMDINWPQDTYGTPSQVPTLVGNLAYFLSGGVTG